MKRLGTGLWDSATGLGRVQRRYFDSESGQAGYFGLLEEASGQVIATLRLRVEARTITEAEWVLSRKGDPGIGVGAGQQANAAYHDPDYMIGNPPPVERSVPRAQRLSRTDLIAVANTYFDGLSAHDGGQMMAHPGCVRQESGVLTMQRMQPSGGLTDCTSPAWTNIFAVTSRRVHLRIDVLPGSGSDRAQLAAI